jgi:hypothetical protein
MPLAGGLVFCLLRDHAPREVGLVPTSGYLDDRGPRREPRPRDAVPPVPGGRALDERVSFDGDAAATWSWQIRGDIELFDGISNVTDLGLRLVPGQKAMSRWVLTTGGGVFAIGIGGGLTSRPLDILVIDDPVKDIRAAELDLVLRVGTDHPEASAAKEAGDVFTQVGAKPFLELLNRAVDAEQIPS